MTLQDSLDWGGREILAIDTHPVVVPASEVEETRFVSIGQVSRPVIAITQPSLHGLFVLPVPFERLPSREGNQLANAGFCIQESTRFIELSWRAFCPSLRVKDECAFWGPSKSARRRVRGSSDVGAPFGGAVGLGDRTSKALSKTVDVIWGGFISKTLAKGSLCIVILLSCGQNIREWLANIVKVRNPKTANIREKARG